MNPSQHTFPSTHSRDADTAAARCRLIDADHPDRCRVERFIADRFFQVHGARISSFMPVLVTLFDSADNIRAAVGLRDAAVAVLFLEYYLDTSIERAIDRRAGNPTPAIERGDVVEIGNLASLDRRASLELFRILAGLLHSQNYIWAVFTGCSALRKLFAGLGIETIALGRASQAQLPGDQQTWGSYYEDNPTVLAGRVSSGDVLFDRESPAVVGGRA